MPSARTTYEPGAGVSSVLTREGVDIGAVPDFWADLDRMLRARPRGSLRAAQQASALREPAMPVDYSAAPAPYDYEPTFATMFSGAPGTIGAGYLPYTPGMPISGGNIPVATGYRMVRRG